MATTTEMADKLAEECLAVQDEIGNDRLFMELGEVLGASSQTLEEAFLTSVRTRMAEYRAKTEPILPIYEARGIVRKVDGMGAMDDVTAQIEAVLNS